MATGTQSGAGAPVLQCLWEPPVPEAVGGVADFPLLVGVEMDEQQVWVFRAAGP